MSVNIYDAENDKLVKVSGGMSNTYAPIGAIFPFGGTSAPSGYLFCDGSAVSRSDYSALFAVIGTSFGSGDGSTTFNVPDFRGKFAEGTPNGGTVGTSIAAGLPNITGSFGITNNGGASGCFARSSGNENYSMSGGSAGNAGVSFNASRSDSIYGNSTTVQPPAVCVNYIIKAKDVNLSGGGQALADRVETLENEINPTLTATFTAANGIKSGGVTVQRCKKIGDGLAIVTGYITSGTVLAVVDTQVNLGNIAITGKTRIGTNPTALFLWSGGNTPQCASCVWKTTSGWLAVPWSDGDVTITEDAWFNAVVRYN